MIREAGIILHQIPLVFKDFYDSEESKNQPICESELMPELLTFYECSRTGQGLNPVEYLVSENIIIIFKRVEIQEDRYFYSFIILDRIDEIEEYVQGLSEILTLLLNKFMHDYKNPVKYINNLNHFEGFKVYINEICSIYNSNY